MATSADGEFMPSFERPSVPLKIGYALENIISVLKGIGLRQKKQDLITNADYLLSLYKSEWRVRISSASIHALGDNNFNRQDVLPVTSDLLKLKNFCQSELIVLVEKLKSKPSLSTWRELAELLVCKITIFSKRRGNEASATLLKSYQNRNK